MIVHTTPGITDARVQEICNKAVRYGLRPEVNPIQGTNFVAIEIYLKDGDEARGGRRSSTVPEYPFESMEGVDRVVRVTPSAVSITMNGDREPHRIRIGSDTVGQGLPCILVSGQCSVDRQMGGTIEGLVKRGIRHIRGCPDKPRSNPGSFYGFGARCLPWLLEPARHNGVESVWLEVMDTSGIDAVRHARDLANYDGQVVLWVGARTQNQILLRTLGIQHEFVVMLKHDLRARGVQDLMHAAGYVLEGPNQFNDDGTINVSVSSQPGNNRIILCVRGLEKPDPHTIDLRYLPNYGWMRALHAQSWAPVAFDPSHIAGKADRVPEILSLGLKYHPDVVMVETHINPKEALSDHEQALPLEKMPDILAMVQAHNQKHFQSANAA